MGVRWIPWIVGLAVLVPSCTLIETYDTPPEDCHNGLDDDWDGLTDCADVGCFGTPTCSEESVALCTNGLDDDGDGRTDFADPTCWPEGVATTERCASVLGGDIVAYDWDGATVIVDDPDGTRGDVYALVSPAGYATAVSSALLTGDVEGLHATAEVRLPIGLNAAFSIALEDPTPTRVRARGVGLTIAPNADGTVRAEVAYFEDGGIVTGARIQHFTEQGRWFTFTLSIQGDVVEIGMQGGPTAELAVPPDLHSGRALGLIVAGPPDVLLGRQTLTRAPLERCTSDPAVGIVPGLDLERDGTGLDITHTWLAAAHELEGATCALAFSGTDTRPPLVGITHVGDVWQTTQGELAATYGGGAFPTSTTLLPWGGAALGVAADGSLVAVLGDVLDGSNRWDFSIVRGDAACAHLTSPGSAMLPAIDGRAFAYVPPIALEVVGGVTRVTVLTLPLATGQTLPVLDFPRADLRTFQSPTGAPGSFVAEGEGDHALFASIDPMRIDHGARFDMPRIRRIGERDHVAAVRRWDGRIELWVARSDRWLRVPGVEIAPSDEDGSFDAEAVGYGDLVEDAHTATSWSGSIVYTGIYRDGFGRQVSGFGPTRVMIRAPGEMR